MKLGFFKINGDVIADPTFATEGSACFDLRADLTRKIVKGYIKQEAVIQVQVSPYIETPTVFLPNDPTIRWMIPSGMIFDIPKGYHMKAFIRGGTGLKRGIRLANGTGIIDDDYTQETFVLVQNLSGDVVKIQHGERLAQALLEKNVATELVKLTEPPAQKTDRTGGFNSTGKN